MRQRIAGAGGPARQLAPGNRVHAARAADAERALLLAIEVEEVLGAEQPAGELGSAGEAAFLVDGEDELERAVGDVVALHDGQRRGHAHAVVGAQGGAVGLQPVAVADQPDGVGIEVVGRALVLLADHVQVALQGGRDGAFAAGAGGLADHDVAGAVRGAFQAQRAACART